MDNTSIISCDCLNLIQEMAQQIASQQRRSFANENRILQLCASDIEAEPRAIAEQYTKRYGTKENGESVTGNSVIRVFKACRLSNITERKQLMKKANQTADEMLALLSGTHKKPITFLDNPQFRRLVMVTMLERIKKNQDLPFDDQLMRLNKDFAAEFIDTLYSDLIEAAASSEGEDPLVIENNRLRTEVERKRLLLIQMQQSFDEQLEEGRLEAQAEFMRMLNNPKYGNILDLILNAQRDFEILREQQSSIPKELRQIRTLLRRLKAFVDDFGVSQIKTVGEQMTVCAEDMERFLYDGTPFADDRSTKRVEVVSPGWQIEEQDIIISYPRVREMED